METYNKQERRKCRRINIHYLSSPVELKINNVKETIPCVITDISSNGLGISSFKRIKQDATVYLKLHLSKFKTENIISKVIWTKEKNGIYRAGLQFINISPKDFFDIYNYVKNSITIEKKLK